LFLGSNLFKRVILQSGSALSSAWSVVNAPLDYTRRLADLVNCSLTPRMMESEPLVRCLKLVPWDTLARVEVPANRYLTAFGPTIDGRSVLPVDVRTMAEDPAEDSVFANVDILLGVMNNEGL